jgi:PAS domain S-box-containing protein
MAKAQILVVEDDNIVMMEIKDILQILGYAVCGVASHGEEAVEKAGETRPDLVLMDIRLKGAMDGMEAAEQIRARFDIPVVYLTALADEDTLQRAKVTEPYGYILKPFEERELHSATEIALYKHEMERKLKESEQWLATTLRSIGDAVIATDRKGLVAFMNPVAEALTGWKQEDALAKDVTEVFNIINGETHTVAESPVTKAIQEGVVVGLANNTTLIAKDGREIPIDDSAAPIREDKGNITGVVLVFRDVTERKRAEEALQQRNRELALLNRAGQAFNSTLELDQVLITVLEEVRCLMDVVACSVWLIDSETDELVCRQAIGSKNEIVRGWRLAPGEGLAGWVARSGESLIAPDTRADERHFKGVDEQTGLELRSILSVPLRAREDVIGVIQVVDAEVDRFGPTDLTLLEPLAATAAIAIENARLYEQAWRDIETKATLLREVNHRVKNNLTAIISLLYAARCRTGVEDQAVYQSIMRDLVNRVQGLSTVHSLLSASGWTPLLLSELTTQVIRSSLQALPRDKRVSVDVTPSPVRVTSDQAHNLALAINELATNTVKHTLQECDTAHITVRIALEDDTVLFEFRDNGPGYPEEVLQLEGGNVGLDLIQNMVRRGLLGELSLHNDHGAVAVIHFEAKA